MQFQMYHHPLLISPGGTSEDDGAIGIMPRITAEALDAAGARRAQRPYPDRLRPCACPCRLDGSWARPCLPRLARPQVNGRLFTARLTWSIASTLADTSGPTSSRQFCTAATQA